MLYVLGTIGAFSIINRLRGTSDWRKSLGLPGHSRWYAGALVLLALWLLAGIPAAVTGTLAYMAWAIPPWGRWYDLGRYVPPDREITKFEKAIEWVVGKEDEHGALLLRHTICLIPAVLLLGPYAIFLAPAFVLTTALALRIRPVDGVAWAEFGHGALWGLAFLVKFGG